MTEIQKIVQRAINLNFDWEGIEDSRLFRTRLEKKKRRIGYVIGEDWRKDAVEKSTIIWEWWKPIVTDDADFPCFHLVFHLIALIQVLSCAVERVFH